MGLIVHKLIASTWRMMRSGFRCSTLFMLAASSWVAADSGPTSLILQSTTSTSNSGLYEHILPLFKAKTGIQVHVVAVGTGQAIRNAMNGDGDVLLVHAKQAEVEFVAAGFGVARFDVMYNDFVLVGPPDDPIHIRGLKSPAQALRALARHEAIFVSRGDDSGTHKKELALWRTANIDPVVHSGRWYRETGSGMGATINVAVGMGGYTLTDRATWLSFKNKGDFRVLLEGAPELANQYGVTLINRAKHPHVKAKLGQQFIDWLLSAAGQSAIASHQIANRQLFFPNAAR